NQLCPCKVLHGEVISLLLDLNSYVYDTSPNRSSDADDASLKMRGATVIIECWREEEPSLEPE
ncbi:MAG: hypothetical protein QF670_08665, partial [Alphaproteobacteria bacterium]|nr:hypothetical protein [Alphaproteobacteria bacterium]